MRIPNYGHYKALGIRPLNWKLVVTQKTDLRIKEFNSRIKISLLFKMISNPNTYPTCLLDVRVIGINLTSHLIDNRKL